MLRVSLRSFWDHKRRLISTIIAIVLGVAFMCGTFVLTDTLDQVFDDLFAEGNAKVDAQVQGDVIFSDPFGGGDQRVLLDPSVLDGSLAGAASGVGGGASNGDDFAGFDTAKSEFAHKCRSSWSRCRGRRARWRPRSNGRSPRPRA